MDNLLLYLENVCTRSDIQKTADRQIWSVSGWKEKIRRDQNGLYFKIAPFSYFQSEQDDEWAFVFTSEKYSKHPGIQP